MPRPRLPGICACFPLQVLDSICFSAQGLLPFHIMWNCLCSLPDSYNRDPCQSPKPFHSSSRLCHQRRIPGVLTSCCKITSMIHTMAMADSRLLPLSHPRQSLLFRKREYLGFAGYVARGKHKCLCPGRLTVPLSTVLTLHWRHLFYILAGSLY